MAKKQIDGNLALEQQRVIVIPAHDEIVAQKLRVAAYARVSSSSEDQLNSYAPYRCCGTGSCITRRCGQTVVRA